MNAIKISLCLFSFCMLASTVAGAQQVQYSEKDYARTPVWISMIKDTATNYFEAEKAYKIYFEHHKKPEGENDDIGEHREREKHPSKRKQRELQRENHMRMDVKRYERWHDSMKPYVQEDGTVLTPFAAPADMEGSTI